MAYFQPYVDLTGMHIPTYSDIRDELISQVKSIYGTDIYLDADSQDYQFISIFAAKIYDAMQAAVLAFNNRSPSTAVGIGLDTLVSLNGLTRIPAVFSYATVTIVGTAGTIISNGIIADLANNNWTLPTTVTIPISATIDVTATCAVDGAIPASIGDLIKIVTPTLGWTSVTNAAAATVGVLTETDSALRARQAVSTAQPSLSRLEATKGGIAAVSGVTRYIVHENDTASADSDGVAAHSLACVVEGGTNLLVATAIFNNKGIGASTVGSTTQAVVDAYGVSNSIKFARPTYRDIDIVITVKALTGYTTDITALIKSQLVAYLNSLDIGEDLTMSSLWATALTATPDLKKPLFSVTTVTACLHSGSPGVIDLVIAYNAVTRGNASYITVTVT